MVAHINTQQEQIPNRLLDSISRLAAMWADRGHMRRFWGRDETLWTSSGESRWLGWLTIIGEQLADSGNLRAFADHVKGRYTHAVLLGMGGSSLCPEVLRLCFGKRDGFPDLRVVDSTDPVQVKACEESIQIESSLFLSASKSGSTLETSLLTEYFLDRLTSRVGSRRAAEHFVAITDPGSKLDRNATASGFGRVVHGVPSIGGRYSALSNFGMVPAAAMGLNVESLLQSARVMQEACSAAAPARANPGLRLGLILAAATLAGRDKLTFVASPRVAALGAWIEQLVAESTGKQGKGIVPVEGEALTAPDSYGHDRLFVSFALDSEADPAVEASLGNLYYLGHPVVRIGIRDVEDIGQEFFRWEVATAVAGSVLGIDPFDQPDVESAKVAARELTDAFEREGSLPPEKPFFEDGRFQLFAASDHARRLLSGNAAPELGTLLRAHVATARDVDYIALLAFIRRDARTVAGLERIRETVRASRRNATCVGFGPRFLHSTGQLHKGGPDKGVFVQIGCDDGQDLAIPGRGLTFGVVKAAQALGDFDVLTGLGRRALRVQIAGDLDEGLVALATAFAEPGQ